MGFRPYPKLSAVHDLAHIETLGTEPEYFLKVSERTLYILQNLAALDVLDSAKYAVAVDDGLYVPVYEGHELWELYQDAYFDVQRDVYITSMPYETKELVYLDIKNTVGGNVPNVAWTKYPVDTYVRYTHEAWDFTNHRFNPPRPAWYRFTVALILAPNNSFNAYGESLSIALCDGVSVNMHKWIDRKEYFTTGNNLYPSAFGSVSWECQVEYSYAIGIYQNSGVQQAIWNSAPWTGLGCWIQIQEIPRYYVEEIEE